MNRLTKEQLDHAFLKWKGQGYYVKHAQRIDRVGNLIEFKISFEDWIQIWLDSGHWFERGASKAKYVMSRHNDIGHYELGNVSIKLHVENIAEGHVGLSASAHQKSQTSKANSKSIMTPDGVFLNRKSAAKHYGITPEGMGVRTKCWPDKYYYLKDGPGKPKKDTRLSPIMTPLGKFDKIKDAATVLGITKETLRSRTKSKPKEYYYI